MKAEVDRLRRFLLGELVALLLGLVFPLPLPLPFPFPFPFPFTELLLMLLTLLLPFDEVKED